MTQALRKQPEEHKQTFTTDMSVGEILRRSRHYYRLSYTDIEKELNIRAGQVEALENDKFDHLPGKVYAIGFVRTYAEHLGLDGDKMVDLYKRQMRGALNEPELHFPVSSSDSKAPSIGILIGCILVLVALGLYINQQETAPSDGENMIPPVPQQSTVEQPQSGIATRSDLPVTRESDLTDLAKTTNAVQQEDGAAALPKTLPAPEKGIVIRVKENSWVEITDEDNQTLVSRVLNEGDEYFIPARPGLKMSLGNAAGVELAIDGQTLPPLGEKGEVLQNFPLDFDALSPNDLPLNHQTQN